MPETACLRKLRAIVAIAAVLMKLAHDEYLMNERMPLFERELGDSVFLQERLCTE